MKIGTILCAFAALALCAGMVSADPFHVEEKPWSYPDGMFDGRDTYPEIEPNDTCPGTQTIVCGDVIVPASLGIGGDLDHFPFTLDGPMAVTLGTQDDPDLPESTDTYIELWSGDCLTYLDGDDDGGPGFYSLLMADLPAGDYSAMVRGYSTYTTGAYMFFFECAGIEPPPENDTCEGAEEYGYFIERCTTGHIDGSTLDAANDYDPSIPGPSCTNYSAAGNDLVYYMDLEVGDQVSLIYDGDYDESMYIVTDCGDMTTCVIGADAGSPETINWVCDATGRYYLILDKWGSGGGIFGLDYTITCPEPTPTQSTTWGQIKSVY